MNKICVIAKNKNTYFIKRLIEEVGQGVQVFNPWEDFEFPEADKYIVRTTGVYKSDLDLMMIKALPKDKVINSYEALTRFRSKNGQYQWFDDQDIPCLPWLPLKGSDLLTIEKFFRLYPEMIVKPFVGQGGWGIEALKWDQFKSWWKKKKGVDEDYLIQPLIKDAQELRYFFIKNESPIVLERKAKSGIVANFQRQGEAIVSSLPGVFQQTIDRLIEKSGAFYGAIDLLVQGGRIYILEFNTVPGIEQLELVTENNVCTILYRRATFNKD